jgi:pyrroloquinoline quinone biosynthesis protein B
MIDATPDFPAQQQALAKSMGGDGPASGPPSGIFLTHAHIGHYTGLMYLGHEAMGAKGVPVYAMPRMKEFLETNGPWSQLVKYGNISLRELEAGRAVELGGGLTVMPILVPHRQEFSEVVGYRIEGPRRKVLFIPDIDSWDQWDAMGVRLEDELAKVDVAYLDGTFFANGEIPGRDMTGFPHPFITKTMERLGGLPEAERGKVRFIHLNHTNPALWEGSGARREVERRGFRVADEEERVGM